MKSLEEDCEELEKLDQHRIESAEMRDQGREALRKLQRGWGPTLTQVEVAQIVKALCERKAGPPANLLRMLERLKTKEILVNSERVPTLWAARAMQALAAAPDSAFSEALLAFYYTIVREIYTADAPDWRIGGARAAAGGNASAYVTGECVRAILGFTRTLENTSTFVREVASLRRRKQDLTARPVPEKWCDIELRRLRRDFYTSVVRLIDNIALKLDFPADRKGDRLLELAPMNDAPMNVDRFIDMAPERIQRAVDRTTATFKEVIKKVERFRNDEESEDLKRMDASQEAATAAFKARRRYERSETGHAVALGALRQGLERAEEASALFNDYGVDVALEQLADKLRLVASEVRRLIHPARAYLSTVLDRELTAASSEARPRWDPAEMAFAAASYGFATGSFEDDRLRRAGLCLSEELSERGRFRGRGGFHVDAAGKRIEVAGAEVLRAFAQLLENVESIPVDDRLVKSMLLFFRDTRRRFREAPEFSGWCLEEVQEPAAPLRGITAVSVLALDRINQMLDKRINAQVFRHFSVKKGKGLKVPLLRNLFYPDYGLRHPDLIPTEEDSPWRREVPVALVLERMRTHVLGLASRETSVPPLFSLILYGPPGTGKTTLVEALAKSADVPLLEITPSDIVSSGADVVERRARAVFKALSLLTSVVILFDEFDPVLKRRNPGDLEPSTVFSFVTPGMLPKLKTLHESAKRRSVAYVLITNLIGLLDGAAVRSGRFDCKLGIYPPDPLSREGRLLDEFLSYWPKRRRPRDLKERTRDVVKRTGGAQMEDLVREGWFRSPQSPRLLQATPFEYVVGDASGFEGVDKPEAEVKLQPPARREPPAESDRAAELEYCQRSWLRDWEEEVAQAAGKDLELAIRNPPKEIPALPTETPEPQEIYLAAWAPRGLERSAPTRLYLVPGNGQGGTSKLETDPEAPTPAPQ